ncbi:tRNA modification GTPase isoform A [Micractinium conductrix]|uniref:tRNA modification GTPase isoform A n=1 Tax=Micractinium conductrix TaxID=554055 RepID=A0A2P6V074_9CHLO|nr:tRNA modification GTPase isoform A [Micractinium conductrix]|eukprot:PSC67489.1 tRNA modification GTPase isoform A [Micractinium conductrix]
MALTALRYSALLPRALPVAGPACGAALTALAQCFQRCAASSSSSWADGSDTTAAACHAPLPAGCRDTIFALSSAPGCSAVAVVRISGPASDAALAGLLPPTQPLPPPRTAALVSLLAPGGTALLDRALVLRFPAPRSFTGEDSAELHLHGSPAVVRAVLRTLGTLRLRPAEPGEFTRRAFDAGKLDLTQVEGLADLLAAETESQRRQALLHSTGAVRRQHEQWRQTLLTCLARLEAVIDFGEDDGIGDDVAAGVAPLVRALRREVEGHLAAAASGELIRSGVRIAIVGPPNAGKSSLLNLLAGHEAAIVSPVPGTTRDLVQVILSDSAGLRQTLCPIEAEGVRRAVAAAAQAQIVLHVADAADEGAAGEEGAPELVLAEHAVHLRVLNKADLLPGAEAAAASGQAGAASAPAAVAAAVAAGDGGAAAGGSGTATGAPPARRRDEEPSGFARPMPLLISCKSGQGVDTLLAALRRQVLALVEAGGGDGGLAGALVTRTRHRYHLGEAVAAMARYEALSGRELELSCEELRAAARAVGRVVGAIDTEAVLDELFSTFCIGK